MCKYGSRHSPAVLFTLADNFFDIGGHSLSIGQLISKIDARVGLELHYSKVFESSSLGALTKTITVMLGTKASTIELAEEEMEEEFAEHHMASPPPLSKNIHPTTETVRPSASPAVVSVSPGLNRSTSGSTSADSTQGNGELKRPSPSQQQIVKTDSSAPPSFQFKVDSAQVYPLSQNGPLPKFQVRTNTPYRLSYNQSSLLFLSELDPSGLSSLAYNIPFVARLHSGHGTWGAKNEDALRKTFATLVERHTALRTVFPKRSKEPSITVDASTDTLQTPQMNGRSLPTHSPRNGSTAGMAADEENLVLLSAADLAAGVAHQIVLDVNEACAALDWETIDGVSKGWTERDVKRYCIDQTYRTFDLNRGPIMRVRLIHYLAEQSSQSNAGSRSTSRSKAVVAAPVQEQHTMLLWTVHHIAVDLWSMVILIEEMKTLYAWNLAHMGDKAGSQALVHCPHLTPSPQLLQYIHCIPAQLGILQGAKAEKLWSYWLNQLAEPLPTLSMPTDKVRPAKQTYNGTSYTFPIPLRLHTALTGLAREEGVTMYTLLLSAFYTLLHVYSGQEDLIVGSPLACRNDAARENVVGYFVNPLPLRSNLGGNPSFRSYVSRVKQVVLGALSHQDLPLPVLAQRLLQGKERDASRTPIWQVLFILQKPHRQFLAEQGLAMFFMNAPGVEMNLGSQLHMESVQIGAVDDEEPTAAAAGMNGHHLSPQKAQINSKPSASMGGAGGQRHAQFDLALICGETHRELCGAFHFNTDVYQLDTIRRMSEHFVTLLESIVANPSAKLSSLNVLPAREKEALLSDWCTTTPYDKSKLIHQLVEAQVVARPDALAICGKDEQHKEVEQRVTFSQMNSRANQLASYLRFAGVNLETPMFVLMNRTPLFIITLLACLKSGGSYVPIDPSYPKQRIEHIMEQAEASAAAEASAEQEPMSPLSPEPPRTTGTPDGFALVLCERSLAEKVPALVGGKSRFKLLFIDELEAEVKQYGNPHNLPLLEGQTSSSCMSMVFTSGSTGKPSQHIHSTSCCATVGGDIVLIVVVGRRFAVVQRESR